MNLIFCVKININILYKWNSSVLVVITNHSHSTQSKTFAIPLQYLKKEGSDEVSFLQADKQVEMFSRAQSTLNNKFAKSRCVGQAVSWE